jgi:transcriptional regulator with XRE-family HTH domain
MTQKQLAEVIGTTQAMIARWEAAKHAPNGTTLMKLSNALNCTIDELMEN